MTVPGLMSRTLINKYELTTSATSQWVEDASFIRLKTITLAYNFESESPQENRICKSQSIFSGTNLLTITDYTGYDPEVAAYPGNDATIGVDHERISDGKDLYFWCRLYILIITLNIRNHEKKNIETNLSGIIVGSIAPSYCQMFQTGRKTNGFCRSG